MSRKCLASVLQVSASVSQVSRKSLTSVSQVPRKCLASVSQVSRKCHTSRECIGETSIVYAYVKGATVECVYLGWLRPPPGAPQQQWCLRECECEVRVDRHATTQGVSYATRTIFSPFFVSENSAALPISHWRAARACCACVCVGVARAGVGWMTGCVVCLCTVLCCAAAADGKCVLCGALRWRAARACCARVRVGIARGSVCAARAPACAVCCALLCALFVWL